MPMTNAQLISLLQSFPPEETVVLENEYGSIFDVAGVCSSTVYGVIYQNRGSFRSVVDTPVTIISMVGE